MIIHIQVQQIKSHQAFQQGCAELEDWMARVDHKALAAHALREAESEQTRKDMVYHQQQIVRMEQLVSFHLAFAQTSSFKAAEPDEGADEADHGDFRLVPSRSMS